MLKNKSGSIDWQTMSGCVDAADSWRHGLLAVEGENALLVSSDQEHWRSEVPGQDVEPRQVQCAGTHPSSPHRHGAVRKHN